MTCQWQLNGADIEGATNFDLTITAMAISNYGNYQAVISNRVGPARTRSAIVSSPIPFPPPTAPALSLDLANALNNTNLFWITTPQDESWFPEAAFTHDGVAAAQSGPIGNNQTSILEARAFSSGVITFWWMVSSEQDFDYLEFLIDGTNMAEISGQTGWTQESFKIGGPMSTNFNHLLHWVYAKDADVSAGMDAGWVDQVSFTPSAPVTLGSPQILADGTLVFPTFPYGAGGVPLEPSDNISFEASSDLIEWTVLTNSLVLSNGMVSLRDPVATNSAARFYRLHNQ
jgi:hypothetical protein